MVQVGFIDGIMLGIEYFEDEMIGVRGIAFDLLFIRIIWEFNS